MGSSLLCYLLVNQACPQQTQFPNETHRLKIHQITYPIPHAAYETYHLNSCWADVNLLWLIRDRTSKTSVLWNGSAPGLAAARYVAEESVFLPEARWFFRTGCCTDASSSAGNSFSGNVLFFWHLHSAGKAHLRRAERVQSGMSERKSAERRNTEASSLRAAVEQMVPKKWLGFSPFSLTFCHWFAVSVSSFHSLYSCFGLFYNTAVCAPHFVALSAPEKSRSIL